MGVLGRNITNPAHTKTPARARALPGSARALPGSARALPGSERALPARARTLPSRARERAYPRRKSLAIGILLDRTAAVLLTLMMLAVFEVRLTAQTAGEYEVKAAFLYKFASFVEWPGETTHSPLCIAVVGRDPFGTALDEVVKGKSINGRSFLVKRFKSGEDVTGCSIVFISASEKGRGRSILDRLPGTGVLTVSDIPGFCQGGGMIEFELLDQKVHFAINPDAGDRARLKLSSKLLCVARIVREGRQ